MCLENSCDIFFPIDKHYITKAESAKVQALAEFLLAHPDFSVALCGYADVNTGTHQHNLPLSERRVKSVSKALQNLGVPADRIATDFKGDTVQPYNTPETNRVVICKVR
jgi:outer membrane protein OmpA-like peptidoglycan-associated protein